VLRKRLENPALKRAVCEQQSLFDANVVLIEDKASGTQLIQELISDGFHRVTLWLPKITSGLTHMQRWATRSVRIVQQFHTAGRSAGPRPSRRPTVASED
jgi:hypothetical protein